jgi:hypothetical protein
MALGTASISIERCDSSSVKVSSPASTLQVDQQGGAELAGHNGKKVQRRYTSGHPSSPHECLAWALPYGSVQRPEHPGSSHSSPHRWFPDSQSHSPSCPGIFRQLPRQFSAFSARAQRCPHACCFSWHMWRPVWPAFSLHGCSWPS